MNFFASLVFLFPVLHSSNFETLVFSLTKSHAIFFLILTLRIWILQIISYACNPDPIMRMMNDRSMLTFPLLATRLCAY